MSATQRPATIALTKGYVALVDSEDLDAVLAAGSWCADVSKSGVVYATHAVKRSDGRWTTERMHSFLTGMRGIDHANGDGLDNRRHNLRSATKTQNALNVRKVQMRNGRSATSRYKGVFWNSQYSKWEARIRVNGKAIYLGRYANEIAAAKAYDEAARAASPEFCLTNEAMKGRV